MNEIKVMPIRIKVQSILKKELLSGSYKEGDILIVSEIAEQLGVSRTPVREALQELENEGLINLRMNKGAIVNKIDSKFIKDHYEVRKLLECEAVSKAIDNNMNVDELIIKTKNFKDNFENLNKDDFTNLNEEIHMSIWQAADNNKLEKLLESLWNGLSIGLTTSTEEHNHLSTDEHIELLEAIKSRDKKKAKYYMCIHLDRSMNNIIDSFKHSLQN